ncbi:TPA: DUF4222 domain-containing protein [Proteus mirabilis]
MSNENPNQLDRYYKNHRGIVVHVVRYDREKQRVIFMLDGCDDPSVNLYSVLKRNTPELSEALL